MLTYFAPLLLLVIVTISVETISHNLVLTGIISVVLALAVAYMQRRLAERPLAELRERIQAVLQGDITQEIAVKASGTVGLLAGEINQMTMELNRLVSSTKDALIKVEASSGTMMESTSQSDEALEQLAAMVDQNARAAMQQAQDTESTSKAVQEISANIDAIYEQSKAAQELANRAVVDLESGVQQAEMVVAVGRELSKGMEQLHSKFDELEQVTLTVNSISDTIASIADQTNLLALNAAIEAARAGEAGRGFAVVAEEVRKLAENSSTATKEIADLLRSILNLTGQVKSELEKTTGAINTSIEAGQVNHEVLGRIDTAVRKVLDAAGAIDEALKGQAAKVQELMATAESLSAVGEEMAASNEEASASIEEQKAVVDQIRSLAATLNDELGAVRIAIDKFKTR